MSLMRDVNEGLNQYRERHRAQVNIGNVEDPVKLSGDLATTGDQHTASHQA